MVRALLLTALLLPLSCGGTWSNGDLAYAAGLPSKASLQLKLGSGSALTGASTRSDALAVGDPSTLYATTLSASKDYDRLIDFMFSTEDLIRGLPPTGRADEGVRVWGPYPDSTLSNTQFKVELAATSDPRTFLYRLQVQKGSAAYFDTVSGSFTAADAVGASQGTFDFDALTVQQQLPGADVPTGLARVRARWATDVSPAQVELTLTPQAGQPLGLSLEGYRATVGGDGSGALSFSGRRADPAIGSFGVAAQWVAGGAGKALQQIDAGTLAGGSVLECWSSTQTVDFATQDFDGGVTVGNPSLCRP
jgi:hypothetical protein